MVCNYSNTIAIKYGINAALIAGYINYRLKNSDIFAECCFWIKISHKSLTAVFVILVFHCWRSTSKDKLQHICNKHKRAEVVSDNSSSQVVIQLNGDYLSQNAFVKKAIKRRLMNI